MKCVILAGGLGTRLSEETNLLPKPMIEIGGKPILWYIMKHYSFFGINDFIICAGYKSNVIKDYFINYRANNSSVHINLNSNDITFESASIENWKVSIIDTGLETNTAGRLKLISKYVGDNFYMTYGDGVGNIDLNLLLKFHQSHEKLVTLTATVPEGRFGAIDLDDNKVVSIKEKLDTADKFINGGFFIINKKALDYISSLDEQWEKEPLSKIAEDGELMAFKHRGFWKAMDHLRDKVQLDKMAYSKNPPWKIW
ncbi:MAG: glucose-1-phosphate cytidylyltransferase [Candidatus Marinimicrobia bacterium]|nr:glucose-1-phosphate cytidylyltransferase [Candidatus Neomarinimicrobiota bacterium]|tara:strand:+ start:642 stop:1406 length:765 start_codon:yes stop_codon:yes gene_type:complete